MRKDSAVDITTETASGNEANEIATRMRRSGKDRRRRISRRILVNIVLGALGSWGELGYKRGTVDLTANCVGLLRERVVW